ncbi:hypothetical protein NI385_27525 (plasmid) [Vibrio parahaemolyticus]|nr:hypothetical protein NI385_27525 [Vibrio parahaemolyticus]
MQSNTIPITHIAPSYSQENLDLILSRVKQLLPSLNDEGAKQYLSDLLNQDIETLVSDWLTYQEVEPCVSSAELHALAERVLPYHSNLEEAIYSVRNTLNTVPRARTDLRDYLTKDRKEDVIKSLSLPLFVSKKKYPSFSSIEELIEALKPVDQTIVDMTASVLMDRIQSIPMEKQLGITDRQKMLSVAAVYEVNSAVGFECNSIWLASFISSQMWGCVSGWAHPDGEMCRNRHFGFKSDRDCVDLTLNSLKYVDAILADNPDQETVSLYIDTMLSCLTIMVRDYLRYNKESENYGKIDSLVEQYSHLMNPAQLLRYSTIQLHLAQIKGVARDHYQLLLPFFEYQEGRGNPSKEYLQYYDYHNFILLDLEHLKTPKFELASSLLGSSMLSEHLLRTSELLLECLKLDLPDDVVNSFSGFFTKYLWTLINDDSDEQYLFDAILTVSLNSMHLYDTVSNIRFMAELGHLGSIHWLIDNDQYSTTKELKYWEKRRDYLESVSMNSK